MPFILNNHLFSIRFFVDTSHTMHNATDMIFILFGIAALTYFLTKASPQHTKALSLILMVVFALIIGLRWNTGGDWEGYMTHFKMVKNGSDYSYFKFEPIYLSLLLLAPTITVLNLIFSFVSFGLLYFICKICDIKNTAFLLLVSFIHIPILLYSGFIRQGVSATLISLAILLFIYKRQYILPVTLIFLSFGIHNPLRHVIDKTTSVYTEAAAPVTPVAPTTPQGNTVEETPSMQMAKLPFSNGTKFRIGFLAIAILALIGFTLFTGSSLRCLELSILYSILIVSTLGIILALLKPNMSPAVDRIFYYFYPFAFALICKSVESLKKHSLYEICILSLSFIFAVSWILFSPNYKYYV